MAAAIQTELSTAGSGTCGKPLAICAVRVLHSSFSNRQSLVTIDVELRQLISSWADVPSHVKESILALSRPR